MAVFDVDFAFSCPCYVSDIQHALAKSTKNYEIEPVLVESMSSKILRLIILRMKRMFLFPVLIIFGTVCNIVPEIAFTTIEGVFFVCIMIIVVIRLKSAINVVEEVFGNII